VAGSGNVLACGCCGGTPQPRGEPCS
jgi:hypothetical protein